VIQSGKAVYETAGALGEGERVWVQVRMNGDPIRVAGVDEVEKYVLLSNSHDGKSSVQVKYTPIRVVCQNTLNMALAFGQSFRAEHRRALRGRLRDIQELIGWVDERFATLGAIFQAMARVQMTGERLEEYLREVFPEPEGLREVLEPTRKDATAGDPWDLRQLDVPLTPEDAKAQRALEEWERVKALRGQAEELYETGRENNEARVKGTLWTAYNGVVEMMDYYTPYKNPETLLRSLWFGDRAVVKERALRVAEMKMSEWGYVSRS